MKKQQQKNKPPETDHKEEVIDYKDKYLRALADYQNLIKRTQQEKEEFYQYAYESFIEKLLPILEHLERAERHTKDEGVELVYKELRKVLENLGLERITISEHDEFNPEIMECVDAEEGGKKLIETRAGYRFKSKIIRPVQVKVIK
jgi:molecular chaperone GrpE